MGGGKEVQGKLKGTSRLKIRRELAFSRQKRKEP